MKARSNAPIFWLLFGAGGMLSALLGAALVGITGLAGPLGGAFFLWDAALKTGDPRRIGVFAFLTPLLSTLVLIVFTGQQFHLNIAIAAAMIIGAAEWGRRGTKA